MIPYRALGDDDDAEFSPRQHSQLSFDEQYDRKELIAYVRREDRSFELCPKS